VFRQVQLGVVGILHKQRLVQFLRFYRFRRSSLILRDGSAPAFELALTLERQCDREWAFNVDQSSASMTPGELCALWPTMFSKTFCYVACASNVDGTVRAGEDVDKCVSADGAGGSRVGRWERSSRFMSTGLIQPISLPRGIVHLNKEAYSTRCRVLRAYDALLCTMPDTILRFASDGLP
jgi:hypothetical protein